ncbi:MAG: hypothetical protein WCQ69_01780 [Bacteroidales bacterium]|nr:hypothetical protein [Bacteroidales bacterium]MDD2831152.1 hypothetical protein [Bacteroidales bacterium]
MNLKIMAFASKFLEQAVQAITWCDNVVIAEAARRNPWFIPRFVRYRLDTLKESLEKEKKILLQLLDMPIRDNGPRILSIIAAGNIPIVCWHDFVCALAYAAGHPQEVVLEIKLSSKDDVLLPAIVKRLEGMKDSCLSGVQVRFVRQADPGTQAILFTGGSQAQMYYRQTFPLVPVLMRTGRTSVAILDDTETEEQLGDLARDCFLYFGLGCRNVTLLLVPQDYDLNPFVLKVDATLGTVLRNHENFKNAFRHARACHLMLSTQTAGYSFFPDLFLLKESDDLTPPPAVLHYVRYRNREDAERFIAMHKNRIQCVAGPGHVPLGQTQSPLFTDYADGLNTLEWLQKLSY